MSSDHQTVSACSTASFSAALIRWLKAQAGLCGFGLALLSVLIIFYLPWLSGSQSFYLSDLTYYFQPMLAALGEAARSSRLPLWNPLDHCGMSQAAITQPGLFYPFTWLAACLPFSPGLAINLVLHQLIAGVGGYLLVMELGLGIYGAWTAGILLGLSGYMFSLQANYTLIDTAAWLTPSMWALVKIGSASCRPMAFVLSILANFMLISSGRPELYEPALLVSLGYVVWSFYRQETLKEHRVVILGSRLTSLVIATLLAMPAILPGAEWAALSPRAHGLSSRQVCIWSANWYDLLLLFLAEPLGNLTNHLSSNLALVATRHGFIPYLPTAFVSPVAVTLSIWGISGKGLSPGKVALLALMITLTMALGDSTPILPWLTDSFPWLSLFRYPVKLMIFPVLSLAYLAARGMSLGVSGRVGHLSERLAWLFWFLILCASLVSTLLPVSVSLGLTQVGGSLVNPQAVALIGRSGVKAAALGLLTCVFGYLAFRRRLSPRTLPILIISLLAGALLAHAYAFCRWGADADFFKRTPYLDGVIKQRQGSSLADKKARILTLYFDPLTVPATYQPRCRSPRLRLYLYARDLLLPNTHMSSNLCSSAGYESAETNDHRRVFQNAWRRSSIGAKKMADDLPLARFCQMTATQLVFTQISSKGGLRSPVARLNPDQFRLRVEDVAMNLRTYEVNGMLPRAYFIDCWRYADSHEAALQAVMNPGDHNFDPARGVLLERGASRVWADPVPSPGVHNGPVKVTFLQDEPEHISLSVNSDRSGFVVLADQYYPGWETRVDAQLSDIYRANGIQRAVFLKPGAHLVEFDYRPGSLYTAFHLAECGLGVLIIMAIVSFYRWLIAINSRDDKLM